jgi:hypothetical protein
MRRVSKHLAVLSLLILLTAHGASAAPRDDDPIRAGRTWGGRIIHLVVTILDQLGVPKP